MVDRKSSSYGTPDGHVPALDGVRGIAILLVMLHHFTVYSNMGREVVADRMYYAISYAGWSGVDLFFVLSGFLITGILLDAKGSPNYLRNFYARRFLRIFPLYYGFLILFFLVVPRVVPVDPDFEALLADQGWYWGYLVNFPIALHGWPALYVLGHFWSLAVEEQFYLLWPAAVLLLGRRGLAVLCLLLIVGAFAFRLALNLGGYPPLAAYVLTPARIDALATGALLALVVRERGSHGRLGGLALPILILSAAALFVIFLWKHGLRAEDQAVRTVGYSLFASLYGSVVLVAATTSSKMWVGRLLGHRVLTLFGRYSYGLYVVHHPITLMLAGSGVSATLLPTVMGSELPGLAAFSLVAGAMSLGVAVASWHLYESRFLRLNVLFQSRTTTLENRAALPAATEGDFGHARNWR